MEGGPGFCGGRPIGSGRRLSAAQESEVQALIRVWAPDQLKIELFLLDEAGRRRVDRGALQHSVAGANCRQVSQALGIHASEALEEGL